MTVFLFDMRLALRIVSKNLGFTAVAVLTLALGIAVNATMFSLFSAFLLRRPAPAAPDRVVVVSSVSPSGGFLPDANSVSPPNYLAWRQANDVFTDLAAADEFRIVNLVVAAGASEWALAEGRALSQSGAFGQPESVRSAAVTPRSFRVLGVPPQLGGTFADAEDQLGHDHVVVLSHDLWVRHFAADPAIVGRSVRLNREDYRVVGVMQKNFQLLGFIPQLWTPLVLS